MDGGYQPRCGEREALEDALKDCKMARMVSRMLGIIHLLAPGWRQSLRLQRFIHHHGGGWDLVLARQGESIAVIPFASVGGNADTDYLSDGLTESLIASLAHVPQLKVKSRNSVFRYKGRDVDVQQSGRS